MALTVENFKFSSDWVKKSEAEFKADMKKAFGTTQRRSKELFKKLHGNDSAIPKEAIKDSK